MTQPETALIVGAGTGLSASLARLFAEEGMQVALAARNVDKLDELTLETHAIAVRCDASQPSEVAALFDEVERTFGVPDLVVYTASGRYRAPIESIEAEQLESALRVTAFGGFLVSQAAAFRMLARGRGTILLTGASKREGTCRLDAICDGQIRTERHGAVSCQGTGSAKHPRCSLRDRWRHREQLVTI
ncbi:SDR family NAD(P)-dependent oxidoreductase [Paraburkholderia hospita]|uniref:SDR family NAD(P)-dependent oxidoreductase n=1 Tax=Paraburkholderia hospita TaxID=169430 RepID=UPI003ECDFDF9